MYNMTCVCLLLLYYQGYDDDVDDEIGDDYDSDQFDQPSDYTDEEPEAPYRHQVRNVMARQV